ncbi:MAG: FHA domain-containing protein [Candidatus Omnitrophica bacterium]|nr:FHA domain-containing protein [Candidatus Omnitrophota bacterium]MCM8829093.1 FHA domain-containing protein [Candidatus Omnitrophota bacterium]
MITLKFNADFMGTEYKIDKKDLFIGRSPDNDITIPDYRIFETLPLITQNARYRTLRHVSRRHAIIQLVDGKYYITDIGNDGKGSSHGTFINNERITPGIRCELKSGDRIRFAEVECLVTID